jgi:CheY-like chemotaxis protein
VGSQTILVADDEPTIRAYIARVLVTEGFRVVAAVDGQDALDQFRLLDGSIDLLLTDVRMPRMDGLALARSLVDLRPGVPVLFISGYPLDHELRLWNSGNCFLRKPFTRQVLLDAVRKCLNVPVVGAGQSG